MSVPQSKEQRYVTYLQGFADREDRGVLAALRRGLGKPPGTVPETYPYVTPWLADDASRIEEDAYYLVASLFAGHPLAWADDRADSSLGASFRLLFAKTQSASIERRFVGLLAAHRDDLPDHLRHAISLLKSQAVPVDWAKLLKDIRWWDREDRQVQRAWARDFWRLATPEVELPNGDDPKAT